MAEEEIEKFKLLIRDSLNLDNTPVTKALIKIIAFMAMDLHFVAKEKQEEFIPKYINAALSYLSEHADLQPWLGGEK